jgi:CHAD domain-containing protein
MSETAGAEQFHQVRVSLPRTTTLLKRFHPPVIIEEQTGFAIDCARE